MNTQSSKFVFAKLMPRRGSPLVKPLRPRELSSLAAVLSAGTRTNGLNQDTAAATTHPRLMDAARMSRDPVGFL